MNARPNLRRLSRATAIAVLVLTGLAATTHVPADAARARETGTSVTESKRPTVGVTMTMTAKVSPAPSGGTVRFAIGTKAIAHCATVKIKSGKASCRAMFRTPGAKSVKVSFSGHKPFTSSTRQARFSVVKAAKGQLIGSLGSCTTGKGALVAASFVPWQGPIVRGCDAAPTSGIKLLTTAGFTTAGDRHDGPSFVCRLGHPLFNRGTQYPTASQDACVLTPPATAYWSFWLAPKGKNTWTYSPYGAYADKPKAGEVEAWVYGGTDIGGTTGHPSFTPNQVRAGLPG